MAFSCPANLVVISLAILDLYVATGSKGFSHALVVKAEASTGAEGKKDLSLTCQCDLSPGEKIFLITWSKLNGSDVTTIFKKFSHNASSVEYTFYGSWAERRAKYDVKSVADVTLSASDVVKEDAGSYRCEVTTDKRTDHDDVDVTVLYGPGSSIQITSSTGSPTVLEGEDVNLTCTASCLPSCNFRWTCSGCMATRKPFITLPSVQRDQAGLYTCIVYNTVSRGRADITLDVQYPATVQEITFAGGGTVLKISEGQTATIACRATGNPPPTSVTWYVTGQQKPSNKTYEMRYGRDYSSVYMLTSASCYDNDMYICTTCNDLGTPHSATVRLLVECAPVLDPAISDQTSTSLYAVPYKDAANLTVTVIARPQALVQWFRFTEESVVPVDCCYDVIYDDVRARITTVVVLPANSSEKYGNYSVLVENENGSWMENVTVFTEEPPQCPTNITIVNMSSTSFCLTWTPGFDGGATQTFLLTYFSGDDDVNTTFNGVIQDRVGGDKMACVSGLKTATEYRVTMHAKNIFGRSEEEWTSSITTLGDLTGEALESATGPWLEVGTPVAVCFILLVVVALVFVVTRRQRAQQRIPEITIQTADPTELYYNEETRFSRLEDKGRRPSSTPSVNVYMDVLGDPLATYVNQDEAVTSAQNPASYDILTRDGEETLPVKYERLSDQSQYMDMTQNSQAGDVTRPNDVNAVSPAADGTQGDIGGVGDVSNTSQTEKVIAGSKDAGAGGVMSREKNDVIKAPSVSGASLGSTILNTQRLCVRSVSRGVSLYQDGLSPRTAVISRSTRPSTERVINTSSPTPPSTQLSGGRCGAKRVRSRSARRASSRNASARGKNGGAKNDVSESLTQEEEGEDIYDVIRDSDVESLDEDDALYRDGLSPVESQEEQQIATYTNVDG